MAEEHWPYRRNKRPPRMQVWLDGKFYFEEDPIFSLADWNATLHSAFKVYFRAYGSELRHFKLYYLHLLDCLERSSFPPFAYLSMDILQEAANSLLRKNRYARNALVIATCFLRLSANYEAERPWTTSLLLEAQPLPGQFFNPEIPPIHIVSYKKILRSCNDWSSINWLGTPDLRFALQYAHQRKSTDALLYDTEKHPLQTCTRHIYCIDQDKRIITPPPEKLIADPFNDLVKKLLLQKNYTIREQPMNWNDIQNADEIFTASTQYGIEPVKRLDNKNIFGTHKPIRELIQEMNTFFFTELQ